MFMDFIDKIIYIIFFLLGMLLFSSCAWFEPKIDISFIPLNGKQSIMFDIIDNDSIGTITLMQNVIQLEGYIGDVYSGNPIQNHCLEIYWNEKNIYVKSEGITRDEFKFFKFEIDPDSLVNNKDGIKLSKSQYENLIVDCKSCQIITYDELKEKHKKQE